MKPIFFEGHCPSCLLNNKSNYMRETAHNEFECVSCHLRIYAAHGIALIFKSRGSGQFIFTPKKTFDIPLPYTQSDLVFDSYTNGIIIQSVQSLQQYLVCDVAPAPRFNAMERLLENYIEVKFTNALPKYYQVLSEITGINLDQQPGHQTQDTLLYGYLQQCIKAYQYMDIQMIDNYPDSDEVYYYYDKHIDTFRELIDNDHFLQQLAIKNMILELMEYLYQEQEVAHI